MRRIEFLAPVAAMRGNLTGSQKLTYPTQNNSAWQAPEGKKSYATNYDTRYIGNKRAQDGYTYFGVKQRNAVNLSPAVRKQMAVLSCASEIANVLNRDLEAIAAIQDLFLASPEHEEGWSKKRWMTQFIREALAAKKHISFPATGSLAAFFVKNPFIDGSTAPSTAIGLDFFPVELQFKFWEVLGPQDAKIVPVALTDGTTGYMPLVVGKTWKENNAMADNIVHGITAGAFTKRGTSAGYSILSTNTFVQFIQAGSSSLNVRPWLYNGDAGVQGTDAVAANADYKLSMTEPS